MKKSSELKQIARESLRGKRGRAIGAMFLYLLVSSIPLCTPAMQVGYYKFNTKLIRNQDPRAGEVFQGFNLFGKSLWLSIITSFFVFLWTFLLIVPGIIKTFAYSMSSYILADNPQMTAREALRESKLLMSGRKGKLFCLLLSFIGWVLLGMITLGIAYIWIMPYMQASTAAFYNEALIENSQASV